MTTFSYTDSNSNYLKANPTWHVEDSPWKATQIIKLLQRNKLLPKTIAEIGCGAGEILNQLHQQLEDKTIQFEGYEIAPDAFEFCLQRKKDRLHYFNEDLLSINKYFDALLVIDVFEHIEDYVDFLKRCITKATYKIYHIPLDLSLLSLLVNYPAKARRDVGHLHFFTKNTALKALTNTQHQIIDWFYTPTAFEVNNKNLDFKNKCFQFLRKITYKIHPSLAAKLFGGFSLMVLTK